MDPARLDPAQRSRDLERVHRETFDLVVIGGGVVGAGTALDAASRGLSGRGRGGVSRLAGGRSPAFPTHTGRPAGPRVGKCVAQTSTGAARPEQTPKLSKGRILHIGNTLIFSMFRPKAIPNMSPKSPNMSETCPTTCPKHVRTNSQNVSQPCPKCVSHLIKQVKHIR